MLNFLNTTQEQYLARNGFVVIPSTEFAGMAEAYESLKENHQPIFVTTDALLHTAHLFFDYLLRAVEITALRPQLVALTQALFNASAHDFAQATTPDVKEAARCNLAFFAVGAKLLDPEHPTPPVVVDLVQGELDLMAERKTGVPLPSSPVLGIGEDYSQYIPRGHYTRNDAFRTYFQAAMWYGRMGFFVYPSDSHSLSQTDTERLARQALLMTRHLHQLHIDSRPAVEVWRGIYETTALFAGRAEDPGPAEYLILAQEVYGGLPELDQLADGTKLNGFLARARELPRPRVLSTFYWAPPQGDSVTPRWQDGTLGFHFLPQRFVPDTHIFSELVWDRVGDYLGEGNPFTLFVSLYSGISYRGVPRGLDVLAAFGSTLAERILADEGDTAYQGYAEKLAELRQLYTRDELGNDLYHRWLGVLRVLLEASPEIAPKFMQSEAWRRKQLNTALGSWAELHHDTILYIKQSYTGMPRGIFQSPPPQAYVEPCPQVFARLGQMMSHLREQLDRWQMLDVAVRDKLVEFELMLVELSHIAERELTGQWPTETETTNLETIGAWLKRLFDFPPDLLRQITSGTDDRMALVADVHTHLEGGVVLEEAVGDPFLLCVEFERNGECSRYWGAIFSYYEFKYPLQERLTDEAWQAMSPKPSFPPWTGVFIGE